MSRSRSRSRSRKNGGAATVFPLKYFDPSAKEPSAPAGRDLLEAMPPLGVRPKIGGKRVTKRMHKNHVKRTKRSEKSKKSKKSKKQKSKKQKGGFVPSVMGGFITSASKYIVPLALFLGYKFMTRKNKKAGRK
jgi:hypothetical protein